MRARNYISVLAATAVLTIAGAALSGPTPPPAGLTVHLMDFDQVNGELLGYPDGNPPLSWYRHTRATQHLHARVRGGGLFGWRGGREHNEHPPSPCTPLTQVWNLAVDYERAHPAAASTSNDFAVLIALLAEHKCTAVIVTPPVGSDMQSIAPSD